MAPTAKAANAIGMTLFFPSMFLAGVYVPRETFSPFLQHVSDVTPLGAALAAVRDTLAGLLAASGPHRDNGRVGPGRRASSRRGRSAGSEPVSTPYESEELARLPELSQLSELGQEARAAPGEASWTG